QAEMGMGDPTDEPMDDNIDQNDVKKKP
ncbi:hypothetical protein MNBD_CHLOROFLEXI01-4399, partial [hydrothermal vent metagenome]